LMGGCPAPTTAGDNVVVLTYSENLPALRERWKLTQAEEVAAPEARLTSRGGQVRRGTQADVMPGTYVATQTRPSEADRNYLPGPGGRRNRRPLPATVVRSREKEDPAAGTLHASFRLPGWKSI
jgi:hypothetical protein